MCVKDVTCGELVQNLNCLVDREISVIGDRMMVKLFLESYDIREIARFAGVPFEVVTYVLLNASRCLEERLGITLEMMRTACLKNPYSVH